MIEQYRGLWARDDVDRKVLDEVCWHYDPGLALLSEPSLILDVGAHIGGFIDIAKSRFPQARVIGIEPDVQNLGLAYMNVGDLPAVTLLSGAVGYYDPPVRVQRDNTRSSNTCLDEELLPGHHWGNIVRDVYSLESLVTEPVDLIKFDCEGAEYHILPRVRPETWMQVKAVVGEYHGPRDRFDLNAAPFLRNFFELSFYPPFNKHVGFFLGVNKHAN